MVRGSEEHLVLVGGVERHLDHLGVRLPVLAHLSDRQLHTLKKGRLRSISIALPVGVVVQKV